ncbi:uncharacterized protein LOC144282312 [Canis aureus]
MPSLRTLSTQGQAQQGQRTFRQEIIPSVTRPVSWSTAHNWQEDNSEPVISTEEVHCEVLPGSEGSRLGRKKLNYNLVTTEGIAHSMESSRAGTTLQSYFLIKDWGEEVGNLSPDGTAETEELGMYQNDNDPEMALSFSNLQNRERGKEEDELAYCVMGKY